MRTNSSTSSSEAFSSPRPLAPWRGGGLLRFACLVVLNVLTGLALTAFFAELAYFHAGGSWYFVGKHFRPRVVPGEFECYREPFPMKKRRPIRIVTIGGSSTYGFGVAADEAWPSVLSRELESAFPGQVEVINLGRLGGHLEEHGFDYERSIRTSIPRERWLSGERPRPSELAEWGWKDLDPDMVIFSPSFADTLPDFLRMAWRTREGRFISELRRALNLGQHFALGFYVDKALSVRQDKLEHGHVSTGIDAQVALGRVRSGYARSLERFIAQWPPDKRPILLRLPAIFREGDQKDAPLAADYWGISDPSEMSREAAYLPAIESLDHEVLTEVARKFNLRCVGAGTPLQSMPFPERLRFYVDTVHFNAAGHDVVAREVAGHLIPILREARAGRRVGRGRSGRSL